MKRTVLDFRNLISKKYGSTEQFLQKSEAHLAFWRKLNNIGWRNAEAEPPETVPNVDATVELATREWEQLEAELQQLG